MKNTWLHCCTVPTSIPADGVELLRHLLDSPQTREKDLEQWIRTYPQIINSSAEGIYPKHRFSLPGEIGRYWEPDLLFKEVGESHYDVLEIKKADVPIIADSNDLGAGIWTPSKPPRFSSYITKAISQLSLYLIYSHDMREYLEEAHHIQMFLPKGILIAGTERDLNSANDLRFLRRTLPNNVSLLLWPAILRRAEHKVAYKTLISFPCIPENILGPGQDAFDSNIHTEIAGRLYGWTGFSSPYLNPLEHWKTVLGNAEEEIDQFHRGRNDDHDEERLMIMRFKGRTLGRTYYKLGKYARDEDEYRQLRTVLPDIEGYATPRSWETLGEKLKAGYEDTQAFVEAGSAACSVDELRTVIDHILMTRRGLVSEPEWFYRRILTFGFLKTRLVGSDLNEILKLARWIKGDQD